MTRQHLPRKDGQEHGLQSNKMVNTAEVKLRKKKFSMYCIFQGKCWLLTFSLAQERYRHCHVALKVAAVNRQAMGASDANGGYLG